jgi:DNA-directed RNA polymerase subunit RPC12/RpoP
MATYKQYQCKHCGYTVEASPKGHDLTMAGEVYTYLCKECREIVDVLTFPLGEKAEKIKCPECGSEKLELWNPRKGKCPKCGGKLEETGMVMMVD